MAWDNEFRYKRPEEFTAADRKRIAEEEKKGNPGYRPIRSKEERGVALNAQKPNSIADMAAVLAGLGRGNRIVTNEAAAEGEEKQLLDVTVSWANDQDREYAEKWSGNVTHELFENPTYFTEKVAEAIVEAEESSKEEKKEAAPTGDAPVPDADAASTKVQ